MSEWIGVEDELPENNEDVLVSYLGSAHLCRYEKPRWFLVIKGKYIENIKKWRRFKE